MRASRNNEVIGVIFKQNVHSNRYCSACERIIEDDEHLQPVTWNELERLREDCNELQMIFADYIADIAAVDRSHPITWMQAVTSAVSLLLDVRLHFAFFY